MAALWQQAKFSGITADSRQVQAGNLFIAYPGEFQDGRDYIAQAIERGATGVVYEAVGFAWDSLGAISKGVSQQAVVNLRAQVADIAAEFYQHPSRQMWLIGVTGTNGKTSCSHWIAQCFAALNRPCALIGTLGHGLLGSAEQTNNDLVNSGNTTPDAILLQAWLADYLAQGAEVVSMEVSSHGLAQHRVASVQFDVAIFTNLSRDHLDYHGSMQDYAATKRQLFDCPSLRCSIINIDDPYGRQFAQDLRAQGKPVLTYGIANSGDWVADIRVVNSEMSAQGMYLQVITPHGEVELRAQVVGQFNIYNLLAVLSCLLISGVDLPAASHVISTLQSVPGRMQQFGGAGQPLVVVDYAHTPDALSQALQALRVQCLGKLICVFGCGGNRDQGKRPQMGAIADQLADMVVITSDNPRDEDPHTIIEQITSAVRPDKRHIIQQREQAIQFAVASAQASDVVLVAGKGHETYQEIAGVRHAYSDSQCVTQALAGWSA
jgi:UDP-N-acetylmuramyl-tripeptide synthetase